MSKSSSSSSIRLDDLGRVGDAINTWDLLKGFSFGDAYKGKAIIEG